MSANSEGGLRVDLVDQDVWETFKCLKAGRWQDRTNAWAGEMAVWLIALAALQRTYIAASVPGCLSSVSLAVRKAISKSDLRRKGFISFETQVTLYHWRKARQELKQTMQQCCLLACPVAFSLCFLMYPRSTCSGVALRTLGWAFPQQSVVKKVFYSVVCSQSDGGSSSVLFQDSSSFCQVDKKYPPPSSGHYRPYTFVVHRRTSCQSTHTPKINLFKKNR